MQSVATLRCVRNADISQQGCVEETMHISTTTLYRVTVRCRTLGTNRERDLVEPREFRTRTSKIYEIFFAVTQETTGAEDRISYEANSSLSDLTLLQEIFNYSCLVKYLNISYSNIR